MSEQTLRRKVNAFYDNAKRLEVLSAEETPAPQEPTEAKCDEYEPCGCGASSDGHCMMCCKPIIEHETVRREDVVEIHRRFLHYDEQLRKMDTVEAEHARLRAELEDERKRHGETILRAVDNTNALAHLLARARAALNGDPTV